MDYYLLNHSTNLRKIGKFPQAEDAEFPTPIDNNPNQLANIQFEKVISEPEIAIPILDKKAIKTDLISSPSRGFYRKLIISERLNNIIRPFFEENFQSFKSGIYINNIFFDDYFILHPVQAKMDNIDYKASTFVYRKRRPEGGSYLEKTNIQSLINFNEVLENLKHSTTRLYIDQVKVKVGTKDHIFVIENTKSGMVFIVSDYLKNRIQEKNCTGNKFDNL